MEPGEHRDLSISTVGSPSTCLAGFSHDQGLRKEKGRPGVVSLLFFSSLLQTHTHKWNNKVLRNRTWDIERAVKIYAIVIISSSSSAGSGSIEKNCFFFC